MKQFYLFLMALVLSVGVTNAADYKINVEWDNAGALSFKAGYSAMSVAADATSFTYNIDAEDEDELFMAKSLVVEPVNGYIITRAYYMEDGAEMNVVTYNPAKYTLSANKYAGKTVYFETTAPVMDASFTLDIAYFPKAVRGIEFNGSKREVSSLNQGENVIEYASSIDNEVVIYPTWEAFVMDGDEKVTSKFYAITKNGEDISNTSGWDDFNKFYTVSLTNGDVIRVVPTEEDPNAGVDPAELKATVTFDFSAAPAGILKSIFYNGKFYSLSDLTDNKLTVDKNDVIRVNFNEDYNITSATFNGEELTVNDNSVKFIANATGTFAVVATEKEYGYKTYTAYVLCPEGLRIANGNFLSGEFADLSQGEPYMEEVTVPAGAGYDEFTIPAGELQKVTFQMTDKYNQIVLGTNNGYWLKAARVWGNLAKELDSPTSETQILLIAKKIENDAKAYVYIDKALDPTKIQLRPDRTNGDPKTRYFTETGMNEIEFDSEYEPFFAVANTDTEWVDNSGDSPKPLYISTLFESNVAVGGQDMFWDSENFCYMATRLTDGCMIRIAPTIRKNVKVTRDRFAFVDAYADATMTPIDLSTAGTATTVKAYALTDLHFYIDPSNTEVYVDDVKQDVEENYVKVTVEDSHKIAIKYTGENIAEAEFTPEQGTVTNLEEILISFPKAQSVEIALDENGDERSAGDIRFSAGNAWAPIYASIEKVEDAEVPTFRYIPYPAPESPYYLTLMIPNDFFTFNGTTDTAENDYVVTYEFAPESTEMTYSFTPESSISKDWTEWGINVAIAFGDNQFVSTFDREKLHATFEGEEINFALGGDVDFRIEGNYFMMTFNGEKYGNRVGTLVLTMDEGAVTLYDGQTTPAITQTWTVCEAIATNFTLSHSKDDYNTETNTLTIRIAFPDYDSVEVFNENGATLKEDGYAANNYYETGVIRKVETAEANGETRAAAAEHIFAIEFPLPTKDIDYDLNIRQGTFTLNGFQESDEINQHYTFAEIQSSINAVISGIREGEIYTLGGIRVNTTIDALPAGLYIINGVKVAKK